MRRTPPGRSGSVRAPRRQGLVLSLITTFVWFTNDILLGLRDYLGCFLGGVVAAGVTVLITGPFTLIFGLNAPSAVGIAASVSALALMGWFFARDYSPPMLHGGCRRLRCPRAQAEPSRRPVSSPGRRPAATRKALP